MNKTAIKNTGICRKEGKYYVVESPLLDICIGAGTSEAAAWQEFNRFVDEMYLSYLEGCKVGMYQKRGRPSRGRAPFNADLTPATRKQIATLASKLSCTQGEVIDYAVGYLLAYREFKPSQLTQFKVLPVLPQSLTSHRLKAK